MGRYSGTLANLVEEAIGAGKPSRSNKSQSTRASAQNLWNKVLHYLENHSTTDGAIERPEFDSPLPPFSVPSEVLDEQLLERKFGPRQDNTILKLAVTAAPAPVVAALCHLQPHAARIPDHRGKLPLHVACRRNPNDQDTLRIFDILLAVYVEALAHRDSAGRTPLHCLFMYHHAPHRGVQTVKSFCQNLPPKLIESLKQPQPHTNNSNLGAVSTTHDHHHDLDDFPLPEVPNPSDRDKVPSNAAIIPDARHGALPLHYAVMEGAPREVLRYLLQLYPESKRLVDRKGRTALAWYLGAGQATTVTSTGAGIKLLVTGEPTDPHSVSWWDKNKIESATVQLLLTSRSARMADGTGRSPLHWAICTLARNHYYQQHPQLKQQGPSVSMKSIHFLLDHYTEGLVTGDLQDKTPLHLLFDAVKEVQEQEWKRLMRNKAERNDLDLKQGGRKTSSVIEAAAAAARNKRDSPVANSGPTGNFTPPMELLEILVSNTDGGSTLIGTTPANAMLEDRSAVFMEDTEGRLPIHAAMEVASSPEVIKLLIKAHPTSLVHTTEESLLSPLHAAVLSPYVAPLQTPETMRLILQAYVASRHGTYVDGRLALKMEDAEGMYPIHYACKNQVCLEVLKMFVEEYPKGALFQTPDGNLPLHTLLDKHVFEGHPDGMPPIGASLANSNTWSSPKEEEFQQERLSVMQQKIRLLVDPILNSSHVQDFLQTPSFDHGLLPLHIVVAWGAVSYATVKRMLDKSPSAAETQTTGEGHKHSPLDLHENFKTNVACTEMSSKRDQEWQHIRELLFSFSPLVGDHRHLNDILTQSVRVVRSEIGHACSEGETSFHWTVEHELKKRKELPPIEASDTFTSIEVPDIDHGGRPLSKKAIERSRQASTPSNKKKTPKNSSKRSSASVRTSNSRTIGRSATNASQTKKSIYDDDALDTGYLVSDGEQDSTEDFDEDYFSGPESVEEYLSDESDERFDSFDDDEEYPDPTVTTATGSWDTSGAADPSSNKESANPRKQKDDAEQEEKKDEEKTIPAAPTDTSAMRPCGPQFSEVGMRLLTFFMLYCDEKNPSDNYASLAEGILDEVSRSVVDEVISMPLPPYAAQYLEDNARIEGRTLREVASPKCRELIHKLFYFLGRFDFKSETGGLLLNKTADSSTVQVRSTEWTFSTEEYNEAPEVEPGVVEAQVWETGVIPPEEVGYMGATFLARRRSICFLFTKNAQAYYNEVNCRAELGVSVDGGCLSDSHIVPLISHFDATSLDRKQDRMYKNDSNNESFIMLDIFGQKGNASAGESICLADYPYALVFPYSNYGDLFDYFFRHGVDGIEEAREICTQIGKSLSSMHEKGIIHGNVSMRNIVLFPPVEEVEVEEGRKHWALTNLSGACRLSDSNSYMGKVSSQGLAEFYSASLPPEMFVKLANEELKAYREYWDCVEQEFGAEVDRSIIEPVVDYQSGSSYVMRCHFVPSEEHAQDDEKSLPPLPYKLLPARESADIWAFGQLLFMLCSCGRPLFPTNARTGNLLNYKEICDWDGQAAEAMIYEYVDNPLAQDILLRLLAPYEKRASLAMETLLNHPFFSEGGMPSSVSKAIADKRNHASVAFRRWLENNVTEKSEEGLLKERTVRISCWDFDFQTRIHLTPTALIPELLSLRGEQPGMPFSFLVLPYKLVRNKKGVLTPPSKRDVERAERLGLRMLALSKACHFVNAMKKVVSGTKQPKGWSSTKVFDALDLSKEDFRDLLSKVAQLASEHVELFRSEPVKVGLKLIQEEVKELLTCYEDASKVSLFLVDEYKGVPAVSPSSAPFPHLVQSSLGCEIARHGLPFMYLCARYFRGLEGIPGFVKLIFEAAAPHVPPSWQPFCKGIDNSLDRQSIVDDMSILCDALVESSSSSIEDSFSFMQKYIAEVDQRRMYANLKRVSCGEAAVWTGLEGVQEIQDATKGYGFKEAVEAKMKTDQKLKSQGERIKELEAELEKLKFRNEFAPKAEVEAPAPETTALSTPVFSPSGFAADLYQRGMQCMEANVDIISSRTSCNADVVDEPRAPSAPKEEKEDQQSETQTNSFETAESSPAMAETDETEEMDNEATSEAQEQPAAHPPPNPNENEPLSYREQLELKLKIMDYQSVSSPTKKATTPANEVSRFSFYEAQTEALYLVSSPKRQVEPQIASQNQAPPMTHIQVAPMTPKGVSAGESQGEVLLSPKEWEPSTPATPRSVQPTPRTPRSVDSTSRTPVSRRTPKATPRATPKEAPTLASPASALLNYLQDDNDEPLDFQSAKHYITKVEEGEQDYSPSLLESLSFECIDMKHGELLQTENASTQREGQNEAFKELGQQISERIKSPVEQTPPLDPDLALPMLPIQVAPQQASMHQETQQQVAALKEEALQPEPLMLPQQPGMSSLRQQAIQQEEPQVQLQQPPPQHVEQSASHTQPQTQDTHATQSPLMQQEIHQEQPEPQAQQHAVEPQTQMAPHPQDTKLSDGAEEVKTLLDDMFAEADLVFSSNPRSQTPRASDRRVVRSVPCSPAVRSPRNSSRSVPSSPAVAQETRDENGPESTSLSSDPANGGVEENSAFLEVTHQELSELKQTLIAGRAAAKEARAETTDKLSEMFQKEMDGIFETEVESMTSKVGSPSRGIVGRAKNIFSSPKSPLSPRSSREPSEVSGSLGDSSIEAGSVKRLSNFFLSGNATGQQKPTIDVNDPSQERPKLTSPQSRIRKAALECSPLDTDLGWD